MLVAKYVKIFSRTGTQPFPLTYHVGDQTHGLEFPRVWEQFAAHWRRGSVRVRYLRDTKILSGLGRWHPLPAKVPADFAKFSTL
jgi:hypothetical protein